MNSNKIITKYVDSLPRTVLDIVTGISDQTRLAIILALLKKGTMTFNEMKDHLEVNQSVLSKQLTILQNCHMVKNFFEKKTNRIHSYYEVTEIPEQLLDLLFTVTNESIVESKHQSNEMTRKQKAKLKELDDIMNSLSSWKNNFDDDIENKVSTLSGIRK